MVEPRCYGCIYSSFFIYKEDIQIQQSTPYAAVQFVWLKKYFEVYITLMVCFD